jgi:3-oxoacyl-[acyl-carrier protein] reductase
VETEKAQSEIDLNLWGRRKIMDLGLKGKVALVTGGSKGLGRAIADELAQEGADVAICARGKQDLAEAAEALRKHGVRVTALVADVTQAADVTRVIDQTMREFGGIDILVNNAGDSWLGHTVNTSDEEWQHCIDVNLMSAVRFTRAVVPHMRERGGGRIINMSSLSGRVPLHYTTDYAAAKAGMIAFSKAVSYEVAPDKILVNSVCPAFIHSPLWERLADSAIGGFGQNRDEVYQNLANQFTALKRFGQAAEVAGLVAFLASERAGFITGSSYDIDGGMMKSL